MPLGKAVSWDSRRVGHMLDNSKVSQKSVSWEFCVQNHFWGQTSLNQIVQNLLLNLRLMFKGLAAALGAEQKGRGSHQSFIKRVVWDDVRRSRR